MAPPSPLPNPRISPARFTPLYIAALLIGTCGIASHLGAQPPAVATVGLTTGWATFGEAVPMGAATAGLQVGKLPTQTDIKNRWPGGPIRFAILTANRPPARNYAVTSAAPPARRR